MLTAIVTIVMFLLLITIHEFGHFIVAKAVGIRVLEFSIGMGPAILKKQKGETLYSVRILPIGGYCKMEGEDCESSDERGFSAKPVWARMLVVVAGAALNILLGFVLSIIIVANSGSFSTNVIDTVDTNSYMTQAGIKSGDKIVGFNGKRIGFYEDLALYTSEMSKDDIVKLKIERNGEKMEFSVKPSTQKVIYEYTEDGVNVEQIVNGVSESEFIPYSEELKKQDDMVGTKTESERAILGFVPLREKVTFLNVVPEAGKFTVYVVKLVYTMFFRMITGSVAMNQLSGPVGVVTVMNEAVSIGIINVIYIVALITINLGVFNLLPLPALDGGRFFFMLIELVRGKPIPPEKEGVVHTIGFILLMLLSVFVFYNDIVKLIAKG